jgi:hypothetical protein
MEPKWSSEMLLDYQCNSWHIPEDRTVLIIAGEPQVQQMPSLAYLSGIAYSMA